MIMAPTTHAPKASTPSRIEGGDRTRGHTKSLLSSSPSITIITVVFDGTLTLERTIRSVKEQTYANAEHIIIDGGSTDGTLEILRRYDKHIEYWVSEKDNGIYDAINKGIALARGEYIGMLNADDYFAGPGALEKIAGELALSGADAVFSCLDIVDPLHPEHIKRKYRISSYSVPMLRIGVMPPHPTFYCRKACYEQAGPYRTDYRIAADFEMMVRLLLKHHITWTFLNETTIKMQSGGLSSRGFKSSWILNREIVRACKDNGLYTNLFMLLLKLPIRLLERVL